MPRRICGWLRFEYRIASASGSEQGERLTKVDVEIMLRLIYVAPLPGTALKVARLPGTVIYQPDKLSPRALFSIQESPFLCSGSESPGVSLDSASDCQCPANIITQERVLTVKRWVSPQGEYWERSGTSKPFRRLGGQDLNRNMVESSFGRPGRRVISREEYGRYGNKLKRTLQGRWIESVVWSNGTPETGLGIS
jgi:hypothetical protein